jgi:hypothetical protein
MYADDRLRRKIDQRDAIMAETIEKKPSPAYVNYSTFTNFIGRLEGIVPDRIDKSLMTSMSGSGQAALKSSLRYLRLTDEDEHPTPLMHELVEASEADRKHVLKKVLQQSYPFLTNGSLNLGKATMHLLEDWFREQGISGTTVDKSAKFFLDAAQVADIHLGPYLAQKSRRRSQPRKKVNRRKPPKQKPPPSANNAGALPEGTSKFDVPLPGKAMAAVILPDDMDKADWEMLKQMFELYAQRLIKANAQNNNVDADDEGGAS